MRFLAWVARGQWRTLLCGIFFGVIWMVSQALFPAAIGQAIDLGIIADDTEALVIWSAVLVGLGATGALAGAMRHRFAVENWLRAAFRCMQLIGYKAADTGEALPRRMPTGEVVATVASDSMRLGGLYDVSARLAGALVSYVVVAVILLSKSRPLGLVVLIGVPILVSSLSLILLPLQKRQNEQREQSGKLITLGADTVAGLRVLRGIGGEQTFLRRYQEQSQRVRFVGVRVAGVQACLDAAQVLLPGVFVVLVTWLGARFALEGTITPGDLVQFYGYAAFLVMPLRTASEFADRATRAHIAARKIIRVLSTEPDTKDGNDSADVRESGEPVTPPPYGVPLTDPVSNVAIAPGQLTAIVSARPEESRALADRLGRFGRTRTEVHLDGVAIADLPLATVRRRIVVSEIDPRLFTGSLREELDPHGIHDDATILSALLVASGEDVMEALPAGLDSDVEERGRTTVVMTASPLLLDQADDVILLTDGKAAARGTHKELLASSPAYKDTVIRGEAS